MHGSGSTHSDLDAVQTDSVMNLLQDQAVGKVERPRQATPVIQQKKKIIYYYVSCLYESHTKLAIYTVY